MRFAFLLIIFALLSAFFFASSAHAFTVTVEPARFVQGDPFLLIVNGADSMPRAEFGGRELNFSGCGEGCYMAIGAAEIGLAPGRHPIKVRSRGLEASFSLMVRKGAFPKQSITLPRHMVELSPEDEARADREEAIMNAIWPVNTKRLWDGRFSAPLKGEVSTVFGAERLINKTKLRIHGGLDMKAARGAEVRAVNNGVVALTGDFFFGGLTVVLDHGMGLFSVYMHLDKIKVNKGDAVSKGQKLGEAGSTGRSTGPHLHYTLRLNALNINPRAFEALPLPRMLNTTAP